MSKIPLGKSIPLKKKKFVSELRRRQLASKAKGKLSNLAFMALNPKRSLGIRRKIGPYYYRRAKLLVAKRQILEMLASEGIAPLKILSRVKTTESIAKKIDVQKVREPEVMDQAIGLRIITANTLQCYRILETLKRKGKVSDIKDYIVNPRAYGYRSIHLISRHFGFPVEIQVRSLEMEREIGKIDEREGEFRDAAEKARRKSLDAKVGSLVEDAGAAKELAHSDFEFRRKIVSMIEGSRLPYTSVLSLIGKLRETRVISNSFHAHLREKFKRKKY